jgi:hypothetical protein
VSELKLKDDLVGELYELDLSDPYTRMFSVAERWAQRARKAEATIARIQVAAASIHEAANQLERRDVCCHLAVRACADGVIAALRGEDPPA